MGRSVPAEPVWEGNGARAERAVWRWAVEQLPDDVLVLPNVMITRRRDGAPEESELDLVLVDPDKANRVEEVSRAIYAAATRARSHLTIVGDPDVCEAYGFALLAGALRDTAWARGGGPELSRSRR